MSGDNADAAVADPVLQRMIEQSLNRIQLSVQEN
jgi:hypothetical protein